MYPQQMNFPTYNAPYWPQQPSPNIQTSQPQTIQTVVKKADPQVMCYYVTSSQDLSGLKILSDMVYIGINKGSKEVYIKEMNDKGIAEIETYGLKSEHKEKTELQIVSEQIETIKQMLSHKGDTINANNVTTPTANVIPTTGNSATAS